MRFSFANSCFGIYIDLTWGLFRQVGKWVLRAMRNFIMFIFSKVLAFQRCFPWEILVVPKRTKFLWCAGGFHSAAGDSVDTVAVGCDFFVPFFGGVFFGCTSCNFFLAPSSFFSAFNILFIRTCSRVMASPH